MIFTSARSCGGGRQIHRKNLLHGPKSVLGGGNADLTAETASCALLTVRLWYCRLVRRELFQPHIVVVKQPVLVSSDRRWR